MYACNYYVCIPSHGAMSSISELLWWACSDVVKGRSHNNASFFEMSTSTGNKRTMKVLCPFSTTATRVATHLATVPLV